jgi:hypothetical protein
MLELAVLARDEVEAYGMLSSALALVRGGWEPGTTLRNLRLVSEKRALAEGMIPAWVSGVMAGLENRATPGPAEDGAWLQAGALTG